MSDLVLRVNPILCDAHGLCAELLPERITLDEWGYPIIDAAPVPRSLEPHARRAVAACPLLALHLERQRAGSFPAARAAR
jgi:ferredoxin